MTRLTCAIFLLAGIVCAEEKPKSSAPEGMTKNMIWLPEATLVRFEAERTASLSDGKREYVVTFIPDNIGLGETTPAIIVRGPVMQKFFGGRRMHRWFSSGTISDQLIQQWNANRDAASVYPLQ